MSWTDPWPSSECHRATLMDLGRDGSECHSATLMDPGRDGDQTLTDGSGKIWSSMCVTYVENDISGIFW